MKKTRAYTMTARAAATAETRRRILRASVDIHGERLTSDISLDDVAHRAGVSVQTVLRHFGSRAGLVEASFAFGRAEVVEERRPPPDDRAGAIGVLVDHYEKRGDAVLLMLAQESREPLVRRMTDEGRAVHVAWVEEVFVDHLGSCSTDERGAVVDLLVVATDVYAWKLLRRDRGLSRAHTEQRICRLVDAVLAS